MPVPALGPRAAPGSGSQTASVVPLSCAAEAWFWYLACGRAGLDAARTVAGSAAFSRPHEPGDIHRIVSGLGRTGSLRRQHLAVAVRYGRTMPSPDPDCPDKSRDLLAWRASPACPERALSAGQILA